MANASEKKSHDSAWLQARKARLAEWRKPRTCLKCGKTFNSEHPFNRICKRCTRKPRNAECKMVGLDTHRQALLRRRPALGDVFPPSSLAPHRLARYNLLPL
ncbi:MAG TPA: hypothetical protein VM223_10515 [Planctomycetota bacterium]|nr:hypothetical protein [Planctomycetota bacterium]